MAKKKARKEKPGPKPKQGTSIVNLPMKGMVKDTDSSYLDKQNWTHARNAINNSIDGDTGVIGNEPANLLCAEIPYTVIGGIHLHGDIWILFSTDNDDAVITLNDGSSEIGEFDDSTCTYTTLINDKCLKFHKDYLIVGVAKENFDCAWQIYWDDAHNPSRTINLNNIPYKRYVSSAPLDDCVVYENLTPLQLDCEKVRLAPLLDTPIINLSKASEGGSLPNGMYQVFIAYSINDQIVGDYLGASNPQPLWSFQNNAGSLDVRISGLDKEFEWMQVVVRTRVHNGYNAYVLGFYSTETTQINIDYMDPDWEKVRSSRLLLKNPAYEKSSGMFELNDYLIRTQPTEQFDFNYQPSANNISTEWVSAKYPSNYYKNGGNKPTFLRDEQYTFFIRFLYNTGEKSKTYHIPGRAPVGTETSADTSINTWDGVAKEFKVNNTATYSGSLPGGSTGDGGTYEGYGTMGYWESTERYPATDPTRWGSLCGLPIRHHKIPDERLHQVTRLSNDEGDTINILGVQFSNIAPPVDNYGTIIPNITGYEILVGNRDGNKSIVAKGIIRNMMSYERQEHHRSLTYTTGATGYANHNPLWSGPGWADGDDEGPIEAREDDLLIGGSSSSTPIGQSDIRYGLIPNYPFNDTGMDPYLIHRGCGDIDPTTSPWLSGILTGQAIESNWITGHGNLVGSATQNSTVHYSREPADNWHPNKTNVTRALGEFTRDTHTFHSPDLNFTHMYLAPSEMVVYKTLTGVAEGQFIKSEKHPGAKLLKNKAVLIAAIIGVGYALNKMRGKRNIKINTARSQSTGETMAVGSGMTPMPGTGTAAAAVNVLLNLPGVVVGAVADVAFNTIVDVASVFGAGKLARQIGTPIYQMIETGTTGLMAGHIGPNKSIEYVGSDFTSVPTLFSMVTGILTFLNYVAIGGDKIIDLILAMVGFQDYAYKYNSHGFYGTYNPFVGTQCQDLLNNNGTCSSVFRHQIDRARYIKPGINYLDGDIPINNLHRPSTVVVRTNTKVDSPSNWGRIDNSKFVIGGGQCAGVFDYSTGLPKTNHVLGWYTPTGLLESSISAHYIGLKVDNDAQYGQLDSILFTPMSQPFKFSDTTPLVDIVPSTRFNTGPLFGGDSYISRYTEKVTMPFWFDFMKDGPDGLPFDYRFYSNIPFPRYWMNTEKYRMDEFVRPITNLSFDFSNAYPSDMYHLDAPGTIDCDVVNSDYPSDSGNSTSNYNEDYNFHLEVVRVPKSENIMATLSNKIKPRTWEIAGVGKSQFITHQAETAAWYTAAGTTPPQNCDPDGTNCTDKLEPEREREVATGIQGRHKSHRHSTPLVDWGGTGCVNKKDDWYDFCNPGGDVTPPTKTDVDGTSCPFLALYDWNAGEFRYPVATGTPEGIIGGPSYGGGPCHHNGKCIVATVWQKEIKTLKKCTELYGAGNWTDSCVPEDDPRGFRYYTEKQVKKEKGWFTGSVTLNQGSFNVKGSGSVPGGTCGDSSCDGSGTQFCRPGSVNRLGGLDPDSCYRNVHQLLVKGGAPPKTSDIGGDSDSYSDKNPDGPGGSTEGGSRKTGGLFVENQGYMYTHSSGVQDFFVESDMNLAFRDWEDVPRKRHYDTSEYTDYHQMFHVDHIAGDNYYKYDKSLGVRRLWTASFGQMQPRWYDPTVSEECFTHYPKRLLYSLPSIGTHTKALQQFKRDEVADHWRTFLPENFRDFKSAINTIVPANQTGALLLFPTLSPQMFQGVDQLQMSKSPNKLTIGDGGLFSQAFQNVANSNVSHEYGSCESSRGVVSTPSGIFYISQAQGKVFQHSSKGIKAISDAGMKWWFNKYLPCQLLKAFPGIESYTHVVDNPVVSAGVLAVYDPNNDILYFSKRDFKPHSDKIDDISFIKDPGNTLASQGRFMYNTGSGSSGGSSESAGGGGGQMVEIDVNDTDYFEDVSWTISYDPKAGAWISFHDWHPELAFNSINHFLTTKKSISATPICPPGYIYNGTTELCEVSAQGAEAATIVLDSILATNTLQTQAATNASDIVVATQTGGPLACKVDVVIAMDVSTSTNTGNRIQAQRDFVQSFLSNSTIAANMASGDVQVGFTRWSSNQISSMNPNGYTMSNTVTPAQVSTYFGSAPTGATDICDGTNGGAGVLASKGGSELGDRTGQTSFRNVLIVMTDAVSNTSGLNPQTCGPSNTNVGCQYANQSNYDVFAVFCDPTSTSLPGGATVLLDAICCSYQANKFIVVANQTTGTNSPAAVADAVTDAACGTSYSCTCPTGYVLDGSPPCNEFGIPNCVKTGPCTCDSGWTLQPGDCDNSNTPECHQGDCQCPTVTPPYTLVGTCDAAGVNVVSCERNICTCSSTPGYGLLNPDGSAMNWETGTCDNISDPLMCNYDFSDSVVANYDIAGMWRHNVRTDKYANFYGIDYPWEVDIIETSGQQVTTVRSVEYILESYVYKNESRDRFHVLDFNFDEAEIYNSEQTSGLLKLNISPKNNAPLITTFPIINATDIDILYSKEEQKYRFNQFWDVTMDRGEFTAIENTIYLTRLNGYIRDLNMANINLLKSSFERKKFRHYFNHVVLRRSISDDKKMLLRLHNTKINPSQR